MRLFTWKRTTIAASVAAAFLAGRVWAAGVPDTGALTYSGTLENADGTPLTGSHEVQVRFSSAASGGSTLCSTESTELTLLTGRFSLALPDTCAAAVHATPNLWAEVTVDGSSLGRSKLGAVPYALEAAHATFGARDTADSPQRICTGSTTPGNTAWVAYYSNIQLAVDTSACGFSATPVYVTSLGGSSNHVIAMGGAQPYNAAPTGFNIFINIEGGVTPQVANERAWHIQWIAVGN